MKRKHKKQKNWYGNKVEIARRRVRQANKKIYEIREFIQFLRS